MKNRIIAILLALLCISTVLCGCAKEADSTEKNITVEVVDDKGEKTTYTHTTTADVLSEAMDEISELSYKLSEDDMIIEVNGLQAIYAEDRAYWAIFVNDTYGNYGVKDQKLADGDTYRLEYTNA